MRWILFVVTLPWTITIGWGWVLFMFLIRAAGELRLENKWVLTAIWKPWATRRWRYSTTLGAGIIYQPDRRAPKGSMWTSTQDHEHIHVRQMEDNMMLSFVIGLAMFLLIGIGTAHWALAIGTGCVLWWSGGLWLGTNFITAGIRHGWTLDGVYRGCEHERSAYAQATKWCNKTSYIDRMG